MKGKESRDYELMDPHGVIAKYQRQGNERSFHQHMAHYYKMYPEIESPAAIVWRDAMVAGKSL